MSGTAELEKEVLRLRTKIRELRTELDSRDGLPTCRGCARLRRHDCGAFRVCPYFGIVDVERDGCRRWIGRDG